MDAKQLRELIIRPTLKHLDPEIPYSIEAEDLLLATACAESQRGRYVKQIDGPALGIWQVEPDTESDNSLNFMQYRPELKKKVFSLTLGHMQFDDRELLYSPFYCCAQARVKYYRDPEPLPVKKIKTDSFWMQTYIDDMAAYWKRVYNTELGKGTVTGFIEKAEKYGDFV